MTATAELEFSLPCKEALLQPGEVIFVENVGEIAQYECYYDKLYTHGVIYFLRDQITRQLCTVITKKERDSLNERLASLNSKIAVYEHSDADCEINCRPLGG